MQLTPKLLAVLLEFLIVGFRDKNWGDEAKALDFTTKL